MMPPTRILVLAMDGADGELLERWGADGTLPNIGRLLRSGIAGGSRGLEGFFVGSTWPSLYTGVSPARHGLHSLVQIRPGTYAYHRCADGEFVKHQAFWDALSAAGRRVAILDVPLSRLSPGLNGIQTVEWGSHDAVYGFDARPEALRRDIEARFGQHPLGLCCDGEHRTAKDYHAFVGRLVRGVEIKRDLTRDLLSRRGWDFFMQVFTESHCAGHQCWHLHDDRHPAYDAEVTAAIGDPIRVVYQAIDRAIGDLLKDCEGALVVFLTAHGMSHWYGAQFLFREILVRLGATARAVVPARSRWRSLPRDVASWGWRQLPVPARTMLRPLRDRVNARNESQSEVPDLGIDPDRSRCFDVYNGLAVGGIRLNMVGREPSGLLQAGDEANSFCDTLAGDLLAIVDERTGRALFRAVRRTAELYRGEYLEDLPDVLVEWSDDIATGSAMVGNGSAAVVRVTSPKIGVVEGINRFGRTGEHRPDGLFIAAGPGLAHDRLARRVSIVDFAPTFLRLLDVDASGLDGSPIPELTGAVRAGAHR